MSRGSDETNPCTPEAAHKSVCTQLPSGLRTPKIAVFSPESCTAPAKDPGAARDAGDAVDVRERLREMAAYRAESQVRIAQVWARIIKNADSPASLQETIG